MHATQSTLRRLRGAVALLALALTFAILPAAAQQWTPQQRAACEPDAMRLCNQYVPDVQRTSACMSQYRRYLSPACRAVLYGGQRKKLRRRRG
jgi:type II secretory pathway component PulL